MPGLARRLTLLLIRHACPLHHGGKSRHRALIAGARPQPSHDLHPSQVTADRGFSVLADHTGGLRHWCALGVLRQVGLAKTESPFIDEQPTSAEERAA